ncbi:DMT family transporter [uncultured Roseovarius sp.]|uniref:DMT family transporter n=1 Tax=uncultured Roseovarius sp. TaxID=293344 RepID=UPI002615CFDB|nr:DMT family transporter [uncultured Roseovarius sp.]
MIARSVTGPVTAGVGLTALYTLLISSADGITKLFAANYAAPQLFALSGGIVALLSFLVNRKGARPRNMRTSCPIAMTIRVLATIGGTIAFFYAFRLLPFAEVFLFIALIPLLAALMSGPILGEAVRPQIWTALALGSVGVMCLFPAGLESIGGGHLIALAAVILGTVSMVASRYIGKRDDNLLAQVFYPNLALMLVMGAALPFVYKPMALIDLGWALAYAVFLFGARWVLVAALKMLPAFVVTPLMNLQFLWMVAIGILIFGEMPGAMVFVGAAIIIAAGAWLIYDQAAPKPNIVAAKKPGIIPAE